MENIGLTKAILSVGFANRYEGRLSGLSTAGVWGWRPPSRGYGATGESPTAEWLRG
jgi:hypothetical protein